MSNLNLGLGGFPGQVNVQPAIGVEGDFCSTNPRWTVDNGAGGFVVGSGSVGSNAVGNANGLIVGAFCWADPTNLILNSSGTGPVTGFVARFGLRADIVQYLADASMVILPGMPATAFAGGDFLMKNRGSTAVTVGMKAYANYSGGQVTFAATGNPPTSGSATGATLAKVVSASNGGALPTANTCTGYIVGNVLTVSAVGAGSVLGPGAVLTTTAGGQIVPGTSIVVQLTGTGGSTGTYTVNIAQTAGSSGAQLAINVSGGGLTLTGANTTGVFAPGMTIGGTNIPTGTTIIAYGSATAGGAGTYYVSNPATVAATASTVTAQNSMFLTVDSSSIGVWAINDLLTGASVAAGTYITAAGATNANLTGLGGAGTYLTSTFQTAVGAETMTVNTGVETKWIAMSAGAAGDLILTSQQALG